MKNNTKGVKNKNKIEKDNKSGIIITKEIKVTPYSCENLPVSIAILQNIFIILVVASTIYCFTDRFINDISKFKLNLWIVLITVVVYQLCLINRRSRNRWPLLGFITTSIVIGFLNFNNLKNSALLVLDKFICYFDSYYNTSNYVSLNDVTQNNNTTDIFIAIAVLMILVISYCVTCYMSKGIYFTVTLPFICICFLVGYVPATFPFYIYIASTFAIWSAGIIKGNYCVKDSKIAKKNNVKQKNFKDIAAVKIGQTIFIVISIMFIISFILFPKKNFNDKNYVTELRNTVQQKFDDSVNNIFVKLTGKSLVNGKTSGNTEAIFNKIGFNSKDPGGISGGTLGKTDGIEFQNTSKLKVTSTLVNDTIYLKGFVGIEYNNGWEKYSDSTDILKESSIENHSFKSAKQLDNLFQYGILSVENISEKTIRDTLIVPYAAEITTNIAENGYIMSEEDNTTSYYLYTFDDVVNKELVITKDLMYETLSKFDKVSWEEEVSKNRNRLLFRR